MILSFLVALLAFVALMPIIAPLLRGSRSAASADHFDQVVYRDQLQELERDIARGLVTPEEAASARLEIQRRLLTADRRLAAPLRVARSPLLGATIFMVAVGGSIAAYLWMGSPGLPDDSYASRTAELARENAPSNLEQATAGLAERLKQNPSDPAGWLLYGRSLSMLGRWDDAADAYQHAIDLGQNGAEVRADRAEVLVMQAGGTVTPAAETAFRQLLKDDPANGLAQYYLAVAAMQAGEPKRAIDGFQALLAQLPADSPLRAQIGQRVADAARQAGLPVPELAKGTTSNADANAQAAGAAVPDAQREAMIRSMVAQLAAKQEADPGNLDGWLRLGRAYAVLHEPEKAADAYDRAATLKPDDISIPEQEVRALLTDQAPTNKLSPRVVALLKRIEAAAPNQPMTLWYLGLASAQDSKPDEARQYWRRLLSELPPGSQDAKMIQSALDALAKQ